MSTPRRHPGWPPRGWVLDGALALAVAAIMVGGAVLPADNQPDSTPLDALAYALLLVAALSLVVRRRYPSATLLTTTAPVLAYYPLGYPEGVVYVAALVALYSAAAADRRPQAIAVAVVMFLFMFVGGFLPDPGRSVTVMELLGASGSAAAVLIGGEVSRSRRAYLAEVEQRAVQAERNREEEARRRVDAERLRIARELHDVLSHSISMMNVQAGVAAHLLDERPEQARASLLAIKDGSKEALRELRATLGVLRQADEEAPLAPTPGLARLDELVTQARATGLTVEVRTDGESSELPDGVDLSAYRILQEALTNVTRHADAARATIVITYSEHEVYVQVDDDGNGAEAGGYLGDGNGIVGMRERVEALGGDLEAGPRAEGGFRVRARLPLDEAGSGAASWAAGASP